jgi:hypothetical protein
VTAAATLVYIAVMGWLFLRRQFLFVLLLVVVVAFTARMISVVYLDYAGPIYSIQLFRDIGGGSAAPALFVIYAIYVSAFLVVFRRSVVRRISDAADRLFFEGPRALDCRIATAVFWAYVAFVTLLFVDLARGGVIPFFSGLERFEYTERYGGVWHRLLMNYGMLLALPLGAFYSYGMLFRKRGDNRFLLLLVAILGYLFLAGHRFSAFYSHTTSFAIPYAAVLCWQQFSGSLTAAERRRQRIAAALVQGSAVMVVLLLVGSAVLNSYYFTRDRGEGSPLESLTHRVFVQQGELWYATWERVGVKGIYDPGESFVQLLIDPVADPNRNTTLPYLMVREIGDRAYRTLDAGSAYTGGFPEIFFELFGPVLAYGAVFVVALITAWLMKVLLVALVERRYLRLALCWYVLFAFVLIPLSGMLNFVVNWKYWLKVTVLAGWVAIEWDRDFLRRVIAVRSISAADAFRRPPVDSLP